MTFLTIIPASRDLDRGPTDLSNSRAFFPAIGLLLGLLLVGVEEGSSRLFSEQLTAAFLVATLVIATRALHLDGLMDVCDGVFGGFTRERRLEIMRDSNVGAFGVAGGVTVLLLKYGALVALLSLPEPGKEWGLLLFPALSRWAMVVLLGAFPYVRTQGLAASPAAPPPMMPTLMGTPPAPRAPPAAADAGSAAAASPHAPQGTPAPRR